MASIQKSAKGYRAFVCVNGQRESRQFITKREAVVWANIREIELQSPTPKKEAHTFADALRRYAKDVSPTKRGHRRETLTIEAMLRYPHLPINVKMCEISPSHFADWRDARLKQVTPGTVLREISLLSGLFECAKCEWEWIDINPLKNIRKPRMPDHREVVISPQQVKTMLKTMHYSPTKPVRLVSQSVAVCFLLAMRTGMRAGELSGLTWDRVKEGYCILPVTKTTPRNVPLTRKSTRLINKMKDYDPLSIFGLIPSTLDANFRKYRERAGLSGFTFHDTRHTAATMLSRKLDVMDLCRMFGWTNTSMALKYYNPTASSIADILNR
jgi:integrase